MESPPESVSRLSFEEWPDDLRTVLRRLATEVGEKLPTAERLVALVGVLSGAVPGHEAVLSHEPKGAILKRRALFTIKIEGSRTKGQWNFTPGQLTAIVAEAQAEMRRQD